MKLTKHAWLIWGIALVAVLVLAFVIPFAKTAAYWLGLAATLVMFGVCAAAFVRAFRKDDKLESKLLGWPIFKVGYTALAAQILVGFALMGLAALCPVWVAILVEVAVFALTGISLTVKDAAREVVTQSEATVTDNTKAWKALRAKAGVLAASTGSAELKKMAEEMRYADPTPTGMDDEIGQILETLSSYATAENIARAMKLLERRKRLSLSEKHSA